MKVHRLVIPPRSGFKKGNKLGIKGKPRGVGKHPFISTQLFKELEKWNDAEKMTNAEVIARLLVSHAMKGKQANVSIKAIQEIFDRTEGRSKMSLSLDQSPISQLSAKEIKRLHGQIRGKKKKGGDTE